MVLESKESTETPGTPFRLKTWSTCLCLFCNLWPPLFYSAYYKVA